MITPTSDPIYNGRICVPASTIATASMTRLSRTDAASTMMSMMHLVSTDKIVAIKTTTHLDSRHTTSTMTTPSMNSTASPPSPTSSGPSYGPPPSNRSSATSSQLIRHQDVATHILHCRTHGEWQQRHHGCLLRHDEEPPGPQLAGGASVRLHQQLAGYGTNQGHRHGV